jgi:hypothetical protein
MSNIFITSISGIGIYAVPSDDAQLAVATAGLDTLISGVANLSYDRLLAWVEDQGGPNGAEGVRTLNAVVEKFTYNSKVCPTETEIDTLTTNGGVGVGIEQTLENDVLISTVGQQQVSLVDPGQNYYWERDATGFLYPAPSTDDVVVGPDSAPTGKWFEDGDLVLGAAAMTGSGERLRVVGSERLEGFLTVLESAAVPAAVSPGAGEGTFWARNDVPNIAMFTDDAGTDHQLAITAFQRSLQEADHVLFVDKTSNVYTPNGTMSGPYNTIGAAVTAANGLSPSASNRIAIIIYPGIYDEAVVTQDDYVSFVGYDRHSTIIAPTSANSPISPGHVNIEFSNLTFETPSGNTDYIVDDATVTQGNVVFRACNFVGTNGSFNNYVRNRFKTLWLYDCELEQGDTTLWIIYPSGSTTRNMYMFDCKSDGCIHIQGDCSISAYGCQFTSTANSGAYYGTLRFNASAPEHAFYGCYIENTHANGVPVWINGGDTDLGDFFGCQFVSASTVDFYGQNFATAGIYGCSMSKGMGRYIRTKSKTKFCNGTSFDKDYYLDMVELNAALTSTDDGAVIHFLGDYTANTQVDQNDNIDIIIDGHGYTWTDTTPTGGFTLGNVGGGRMLVRNLNFIGATVYCQGSGTHLIVDNCYIEGVVYQRGIGDDATTRTVIHNSTVIGITGGASLASPLRINAPAPTIIVSKSYLKGFTGAAAVNYLGHDNDSVEFEYSKVFHGDLGSNNPFTGEFANDINYKAHHTTFNQEPALAAPASYVNDIDSGQRHNTIDPDGDFVVMDDAF